MERIVDNDHLFQSCLDEAEVHYDKKLDSDIGRLLSRLSLTISVAESLTGGLLAKRLTDIPGSSAYFIGGIVCYHSRIKVQLCGVLPETLKRNGPVSEATAREMAMGVRNLMKTDISIATTGFAGPSDGSNQENVGLSYVAHVFGQKEKVKRFSFEGTRHVVREETVNAALSYLRQYLLMLSDQ